LLSTVTEIGFSMGTPNPEDVTLDILKLDGTHNHT
jgi:hypothetical protein